MDPCPSRCYHARMAVSRMLLGIAFALSGCVAGRVVGEDPDFRERLLGTISEDARVLVPPVFSGDGRHAAWVEQSVGACRVVCGARRDTPPGAVC